MSIRVSSIFSKTPLVKFGNSLEFYKKHPDLAPRNVYLYLGRVVSKEEVEKKIDKLTRPSMYERLKNLFKIKK